MQVIYGVNPVKETLLDNKVQIEKVVLAKGRKGRDIQKILELSAQKGVAVEYNDRNYISNISGHKSHQGVICICGDYIYASVDDIIANCHESLKGGLVLILDGIEDPQNLGSMIRTGHCFGINGIIIPQNRAASVTPAVIKVSAGTARHIPIARVVNISSTIDYLKARGFWIYGADVSSDKDLYSCDYKGQTGLVMGSEGKGIRPLVRKKCDFLISIRMSGNIDSLNVSVAAGIILYEMTNKRGRY